MIASQNSFYEKKMGKANKKMQGVAAMNKLSPFLVNL